MQASGPEDVNVCRLDMLSRCSDPNAVREPPPLNAQALWRGAAMQRDSTHRVFGRVAGECVAGDGRLAAALRRADAHGAAKALCPADTDSTQTFRKPVHGSGKYAVRIPQGLKA